MGLFGGNNTKTCPNCGKELNQGEGIRREDGHFCCDKCCEAGPRKDLSVRSEQARQTGKKMTCEFC